MLAMDDVSAYFEDFSDRCRYRHDYRPDKVTLREFLKMHSTEALMENCRVFIGPYWPIEIVDSMGRWLEIVYPIDAARHSGAFGTPVKVSDVLRWRAKEESDSSRASYHIALADALDAGPTPRPVVGDPSVHRNQLLTDYMELLALIQGDFSAWSPHTLSTVDWLARRALRGVVWGETLMPPLIPYPADFLPPWASLDRDGYGGIGLQANWVLHNALRYAEHVPRSEQYQIARASDFYPDCLAEFNVIRPNKEPVSISGLSVYRELDLDEYKPAIGSVRIKHFEAGSCFSPDPNEFEFRLHEVRVREVDCAEYCLVSDHVTYIADEYTDD